MEEKGEVFIIDDDPVTVILVERVLEKGEFCDKTQSFGNGKKAYEYLKKTFKESQKRPSFILLDLNMPVWNGWDFLEAVQADKAFKDLRVIINSSSHIPEEVQRAESFEMVKGIIKKPLTATKLRHVVGH